MPGETGSVRAAHCRFRMSIGSLFVLLSHFALARSAPSDGLHSKNLGTMSNALKYASESSAWKASIAEPWTRLIVDPPNPAPVSLEPATPSISRAVSQVKLGTADFIVVSEAVVRLVHQISERLQVAAIHRIHRLQHPGVLVHGMATAAKNDLGQILSILIELRLGDVAESADVIEFLRQDSEAFFAFGPALVVF